LVASLGEVPNDER
jgi:hypothetical protein